MITEYYLFADPDFCWQIEKNGVNSTRHIYVMISIEQFREMALSLPEAEERDHFGRPSFRVRNKIFATLWIREKRAMVKLSPVDQAVFCDLNKAIFYPVPGVWGKRGSTFIELNKASRSIAKEALLNAWQQAAPQLLIKRYTAHRD